MKNKVFLFIAFMLVTSLIIAGCAAPAPTPTPAPAPTPAPKEVKPIVLEAVGSYPVDSVLIRPFSPFLEAVESKVKASYPGQLEIKHKGGPEVIPPKELAEALKGGVIDMFYCPMDYYAGLLPEQLPEKVFYMEAWEERESGVFDYLNNLHQQKVNSIIIGRMIRGTPIFQLYSNVHVNTPRDLKGLTFRMSPWGVEFLKALGVTSTWMPPGDIYTGLERGLVDGFGWPAYGIRDWGWQEVTKYFIQPTFYSGGYNLAVNLDTWNRIPQHLQDLLIEAARETEPWAWDDGTADLEAEDQKLRDAGMEDITFLPADEEWYLKTANEVIWKKSLEDMPHLNELKQMIEAWRAKHPSPYYGS